MGLDSSFFHFYSQKIEAYCKTKIIYSVLKCTQKVSTNAGLTIGIIYLITKKKQEYF